MNALWEVPVVVAALVAWLTAPPVTIGDAAEREALRRQLTTRSIAAYTNVDLPPPQWSDVTVNPGGTVEAASAAPVQPAVSVDPEGAGESWWRSRAASLRISIDRNQLLTDAMQTRVNALTSDVVSRDDPFQREALREQLQRAITEFDRLQSAVLDSRRQLEQLHTEARRRGIPPGWLRE
jgi:hypothetical protein